MSSSAVAAAFIAVPAVVVPEPRVAGELAPHKRELLRQRVIERLGDGGFAVKSAPAPDPACQTAACWQGVARDNDASYVLDVSVVVDEHDYKATVELLDGASGRSVARGEDACNVCGVEEVGDMLADQAAVVRDKVGALLAAPPRITVKTVPEGARVYVDQRVVGEAPVEYVTSPGAHTIRVERRGYISMDVPITATAGLSESYKLELSRVPRLERARPWAWTMVALGGAGLVAGVTLLALHDRPYPYRCSGGNVDAFGNCRFEYRTQTTGIVFTVVGAAVLTAGAIVVGLSRRRASR